MDARLIRFGEIEIDGERFDHDVVIERGRISKRRKKASKPLRARYGHTPLTLAEQIPWSGRRLIIGTGANGQLPIADDILDEAASREIELVVVRTEEACLLLRGMDRDEVTAVLHVTC